MHRADLCNRMAHVNPRVSTVPPHDELGMGGLQAAAEGVAAAIKYEEVQAALCHTYRAELSACADHRSNHMTCIVLHPCPLR